MDSNKKVVMPALEHLLPENIIDAHADIYTTQRLRDRITENDQTLKNPNTTKLVMLGTNDIRQRNTEAVENLTWISKQCTQETTPIVPEKDNADAEEDLAADKYLVCKTINNHFDRTVNTNQMSKEERKRRGTNIRQDGYHLNDVGGLNIAKLIDKNIPGTIPKTPVKPNLDKTKQPRKQPGTH